MWQTDLFTDLQTYRQSDSKRSSTQKILRIDPLINCAEPPTLNSSETPGQTIRAAKYRDKNAIDYTRG